jgi:hypothetical protein
MSIPVICDRCRSTGIAGESDFSHLGDLLEFTPVPRKTTRVDGWTVERQRAFIAALSATGSKRRAAQSIGMATFGVDQLLKAEGNESFKAAYDRAMAIAAQHGSMKIAQGVADAAARNAQLAPPSRLRDLPSRSEDGWDDQPEVDQDEMWRLIERIGLKFMKKIAAERQARLAGEIVAADFYLRQITVMELCFDLAAQDFGFDAREALRELRRGDYSVFEIVTTPMVDWLDRARRDWWRQEGEPERPVHPDPRFLEWKQSMEGEYAVARQMHAAGCVKPPPGISEKEWAALSNPERQAIIDRVRAEDAAAQMEWERRARDEAEARHRT